MRSALAFWGCCTLLATMGCAMCANPHDCSYAAYGGRIQRVDRVHGRVGSILDPDAGDYSAAADASMLVPTPADEQVEGEVLPVEPVPWQPERPAPRTCRSRLRQIRLKVGATRTGHCLSCRTRTTGQLPICPKF